MLQSGGLKCAPVQTLVRSLFFAIGKQAGVLLPAPKKTVGNPYGLFVYSPTALFVNMIPISFSRFGLRICVSFSPMQSTRF